MSKQKERAPARPSDADQPDQAPEAAETPPPLSEAEIQTLASRGIDAAEPDKDFEERLAAEKAEADRIRELTPIQEIELRPCVGASHLGVIITGPDGVRCVSLADWRTDRLVLRAGDHAQLVVLAGEGLKTWEFYRGQEDRAKTRSQLGLGAGGAPAVDPLEETQPAGGETIPAASETKAANPETTA